MVLADELEWTAAKLAEELALGPVDVGSWLQHAALASIFLCPPPKSKLETEDRVNAVTLQYAPPGPLGGVFVRV